MIETETIERNELDHVCSLAALTGEHVLVAGPPGTAKSLHAERFFSHFPTAKHFACQLTKFSTEEVVFGPLDVALLREGIYEYMYENTILDSHFAFIDEMFDASDVLMRSLLGVLNERKLQKGSFKKQTPLISAVATANYTRLNDVTEAVVDRFMFQMWVEPIEDKQALIAFDELGWKPKKTYTLSVLKKMQKQAMSVQFPKEIREPFIDVCKALGFTDRRIVKAVKVVKANAFNEQRGKVGSQDLAELKYLSSLDKANMKNSEGIIRDMVDNVIQKAQQISQIDLLVEKFDDVPGGDRDESHLKREKEILIELLDIRPADEEVADYRDRYYRVHEEHYEHHKQGFLRGIGLD